MKRFNKNDIPKMSNEDIETFMNFYQEKIDNLARPMNKRTEELYFKYLVYIYELEKELMIRKGEKNV